MQYWFQQAAKAPCQQHYQAAQAQQEQLTKPPGSLGMLEQAAIDLSALQACSKPSAEKVYIAIFAADHGVCEEGVSAFPQVVTAEMVRNFSRGGAAISVLAKKLGARFKVINMGTVEPMEALPGVENVQIANGTANFAITAAMSHEQCLQAINAGKNLLDQAIAAGDIDIFIGGEMGIGNTTSASALTAWALGLDGVDVVGPGTGVDAEGLVLKAAVVDKALALHQTEDALQALAAMGGLEIAALAGAYIRAAQLAVPVLLDGFISTLAALMAVRINPTVKSWLLFSHQSAEPAHQALLHALQARPLLSLDMRLGEGSGAALAVDLLRGACALHNQMASFADAGVSQE